MSDNNEKQEVIKIQLHPSLGFDDYFKTVKELLPGESANFKAKVAQMLTDVSKALRELPETHGRVLYGEYHKTAELSGSELPRWAALDDEERKHWEERGRCRMLAMMAARAAKKEVSGLLDPELLTWEWALAATITVWSKHERSAAEKKDISSDIQAVFDTMAGCPICVEDVNAANRPWNMFFKHMSIMVGAADTIRKDLSTSDYAN